MVQNLQENTSVLRHQVPLTSNTIHWLDLEKRKTPPSNLLVCVICSSVSLSTLSLLPPPTGGLTTHMKGNITLTLYSLFVSMWLVLDTEITTIISFIIKTTTCIIVIITARPTAQTLNLVSYCIIVV